MENKVLIFGDSYADPGGCPEYAWHRRLKNIFPKTHNFAESGTGPHYAFDLFYNKLSNLKKDNIIIFLLSDPFRINWPDNILSSDWGARGELSAVQWDTQREELICVYSDYPENLINSKHMKVINYYNEHKKEMEFFYKTYMEELKFSSEKNISFLYAISQALNLKVIVFELFPRKSPGISKHELLQQRTSSQHYTRNRKMSRANFHLCDQFLGDISHNEVYKDELYKYATNLRQGDSRVNHFSPENHTIMFEYILNFLNFREGVYNKPFPKFKQHFRHYDDIWGPDAKFRFIYE